MIIGHWILDENGEPVPEPDLLTWALWFEHAHLRRAAFTRVAPHLSVSTIFLGIDHNFLETGPPILWETMVFYNGKSNEMRRYASRSAAMAGHQAMVEKWRRHWRWRWVLDPLEWLLLRWTRATWWIRRRIRQLKEWWKRWRIFG
jgi:hypothetical protein